MSSRTAKRLLSEINDGQIELASNGIRSLCPISDDNILLWKANITGPSDTPYAEGAFELLIKVPENYPASPPLVSFVQQIYHPNIHFKTGEVCLDVLKDQWSPIWTLGAVCLAVQALLASPEPNSPLNVDAANLIRCGDRLAFESLAGMYVAIGKQTPSTG